MKKIYPRIAASILSILTAITLIAGASYAWFVMSASPEATGMLVKIAGRNTIMVAADMTAEVVDEDGNTKVVHYPGEFASSLNLADYETYDYLHELSELSPVSTADGLYFMSPTYDEETGALLDYTKFEVDGTLEHANGRYAYLDFWIIAPGSEYDIHVSTDKNSKQGSYVMELPKVIENEEGGFSLDLSDGVFGSIARVGFLVNSDDAGQEALDTYMNVGETQKHYKSLQGVYHEPGNAVDLERQYQFMIYEPNGTTHPSGVPADGTYEITTPLAYSPYGNTIYQKDVEKYLAVQNKNTWKTYNTQPLIEQIFQTSITGIGRLTAEEAKERFYEKYLQGQLGTYVSTGDFFASTAALYTAAQNGLLTGTAGATDDAVITTLKADTPQRIRMFIWLEGQDPDCVNETTVDASQLSLSIELSGANE